MTTPPTTLAPASVHALADQLHKRKHRPDIIALPSGNLLTGLSTLLSQESFLVGWSVATTSGGPFVATIIDGDDVTGMVVAAIVSPASGGTSFAFPGEGLRCRAGLTLNVLSGTAAGSVLLRPSR